MTTTTTIWKFELPLSDVAKISMPVGAEVLYVAMQRDIPHLWARVPKDGQKVEQRRFRVCGTGSDLDQDAGSYIGSFQMHGGNLVFHVFEVRA